MTRPQLIAGTTLLIVLTAGHHAAANPTGPVPPEARTHFDAGDKAYKLGDFARAIEEYRKSYELYSSPVLLWPCPPPVQLRPLRERPRAACS